MREERLGHLVAYDWILRFGLMTCACVYKQQHALQNTPRQRSNAVPVKSGTMTKTWLYYIELFLNYVKMIKNKNQFVIILWVENNFHMSSSEYRSVPL